MAKSITNCSLRGSNSSNSDGSFQYKDKVYSSASQALQAYIDDFDLSQMYPEFSNYIYKPNNAFDNVDQKKSSLSLSCRRKTVSDIDSISLTTDDLLKLPADGSFSFAYVGSDHQISKKKKKCIGRLSSSDTEKKQKFQEPSTLMCKDDLVTPVVYTDINRKQCGRLKNPKLVKKTNKCISEPSLLFSKKLSFKDSSEHSLEKNYPRWLTSQKYDLNVSGITMVTKLNCLS
uniref:Lung adenoma susceptibility protein 2 n=1 Tax=Suricata suricatta TaxID=37032 RepID=A0A673TMF5_SURSU